MLIMTAKGEVVEVSFLVHAIHHAISRLSTSSLWSLTPQPLSLAAPVILLHYARLILELLQKALFRIRSSSYPRSFFQFTPFFIIPLFASSC